MKQEHMHTVPLYRPDPDGTGFSAGRLLLIADALQLDPQRLWHTPVER
jgi:hypothetical protein